MEKKYKAIAYQKVTHHKVQVTDKLWDEYDDEDTRYCIVSTETGEILDDAQGYGYKSAQKAYAGYAYNTRDKSKDKEKLAKIQHIMSWLKEHRDFERWMDGECLDMIRDFPDCHPLDAKKIKRELKRNNLEIDFTAGELLKVWRDWGKYKRMLRRQKRKK